MVDVAEGSLLYLAYNHLADPTVVRPYAGPLNERQRPSPLAVLVFRQRRHRLGLAWEEALGAAGDFSLPDFILANGLQGALIVRPPFCGMWGARRENE